MIGRHSKSISVFIIFNSLKFREKVGRVFRNIASIPGRDHKNHNGRVVLGKDALSTDLFCGAFPANSELNWGSVLNPNGHLYLEFFQGPVAITGNQVALQLINFWQQFCGREDRDDWKGEYCLGLEPAVGYFAKGLEYSLAHPTLLNTPTTVGVPLGQTRRLYHGTAFVDTRGILSNGVSQVEPTKTGIRVADKNSIDTTFEFKADHTFAGIASLVTLIDQS